MEKTKQQLSQEAINTAIKSPEHLKMWLEESGRKWILLDGMQLVDALTWPDGVEAFTQIIMAYRDYRATLPSGNFENITDETTGESVKVPTMHTEMLTIAELDRAIRYLIQQASKLDSSWKLENPPL